jgi:glycosyltransferase involved in cell wall biosynthesis
VTLPKVSVLLPTYNRERFIAESLESIFAQTLPPSQVIVINDGSTDNTKFALKPFFERIEYLESENRGKPTALNLGMARVTGDYVWIMDDDDVALPDTVSRHSELLQQRPNLGWTYSGYIESTSRSDSGRINPVKNVPLPPFPEEEFFIRLMEECFLIHPTILVRTNCYRELGPFNTNLIRSQDYEMALRLGRNYPCARLSGPTIYRRLDSGQRGSSADRFDPQKAQAKWAEYDLLIFNELRRTLPLSAYLPQTFLNGADISDHERRAYLQRMVIMGKKTLYGEMLEDLRNALASKPDAPLSKPESAVLRRLASDLSGDPLLSPGRTSAIRSICTGPAGLSVRLELAQALRWRAATGWRNRDYREILRTLAGAARIAGLQGLISVAASKIARARSSKSIDTTSDDGQDSRLET